ncbi:MAG: pseudouridine synthase [Burkholderiaceae bacterium]
MPFTPPEPLLPTAPPSGDALHILWRDDRLVAIYKPAGWLVHRTALDAHETRWVVQALRNQLGRLVYPVHRLDKGTCGVLLLALDADAARALGQAFMDGRVHKRYLAVVRGWPNWTPSPPSTWDRPSLQRIDHPLRPDDAPPDAPVQPACTQVRRIATLAWPEAFDARFADTHIALVEAHPLTGRRHQIRRHLKHAAHPIIGDATHGKGPLNRWWAERLGVQRLWLHAWSLQFQYPFPHRPSHPGDAQVVEVHSGLGSPASPPLPAQGLPHASGDLALWQRTLCLPWQMDAMGPHTPPD